MSTIQQIDHAADVHARRTVRNVHLLHKEALNAIVIPASLH